MVFERFGIDYCCQGRRSLRDAIAAAGVDENTVAAALDRVIDGRDADIDALAPSDLVSHIVGSHHAYLHEELPALDALAAKVGGVHGQRHPELTEVARLVSELRADLEPHLAKEEDVLFPAIHEMARGPAAFPFGPISNPIQVMLSEHDRVGELLASLRATTADFAVPDDGCASYHALYGRLEHLEADTHRHVHLENNVLFPAVLALAS
jgi:regulator of cell morphogenesis and NO signaling